MYDLQRPVWLFHHRRPVLHPITVVHIQDGSDQPIIRAMNMSADHAIGFVVARSCKDRSIPEVSEELNSLACGVTEIVGKRAAFIPFPSGLTMVPVMEPLGSRVRVGSNHRQQTIWIERAVELMAMGHEHPGAVGCGVNQRTCGRDRAE